MALVAAVLLIQNDHMFVVYVQNLQPGNHIFYSAMHYCQDWVVMMSSMSCCNVLVDYMSWKVLSRYHYLALVESLEYLPSSRMMVQVKFCCYHWKMYENVVVFVDDPISDEIHRRDEHQEPLVMYY